MDLAHATWERRLADLWARIDEYEPAAFIDAMRLLIAELPEGDPIAQFELGAAYDSTGTPEAAVTLYESALRAGLTGIRRRRVKIQMASSLRNLGRAQQAAEMLFAEMEQPSDELDQAVAAFLALALSDLGREREALSISLEVLAKYLPRYNRSLARYAPGPHRRGLTTRSTGAPTAGHQAPSVASYIRHSPGLVPCRRRPVNSNVRQHKRTSMGREQRFRSPVALTMSAGCSIAVGCAALFLSGFAQAVEAALIQALVLSEALRTNAIAKGLLLHLPALSIPLLVFFYIGSRVVFFAFGTGIVVAVALVAPLVFQGLWFHWQLQLPGVSAGEALFGTVAQNLWYVALTLVMALAGLQTLRSQRASASAA